MPKISVIIPTYNRKDLLPRALQSVLNQTYKDFELIIVDDGSTDNTKEIVEEFQKKDPRIFYLRNEKNNGQAAARNLGIKSAKGEYIAFQDSDDEWLPEKLEKQKKVFERGPEDLGVVYTWFLIQDDEEKKILEIRKNSYKGDVFLAMLNTPFLGLSTLLIKKEVFQKVGLFDESLRACEDADFFIRAAKEYKFDFVGEPLVIYNIHKKGQTKDDERAKGFVRVFEKYQSIYKSHPKILSNQFNHIGSQFFRTGDKKTAREYFIKSIKAYPKNISSYFYFLISFFGEGFYEKIARLKRTIDI
ncbi:MAG TPA: glycosyltransferase family 2 protein [Candidatus Pacearchaeota archaeon]|nr:glycosyltransferase family 2 protein [Candidatus Pacearchaeota archaeon]HOK94427.1 glycosyltransferase family 2 protein [Candidatus Pacearchaeota archaeon]HPO75489.1 glycosyltransferase family 2 protein [Candidatus Pacearchaeota archaeon]